MNSVNKWQSFTALPGPEVQISNQLAENLTPYHFFPPLFPRHHMCLLYLQGNQEIWY